MTSPVDNNKGLEYINKFLEGAGLKDIKVSSSDVGSIFKLAKEADTDEIITQAEFNDAISEYYNQDKMDKLEDDYLDAWESFAGADGNTNGLAATDFSANASYNFANSGNYRPDRVRKEKVDSQGNVIKTEQNVKPFTDQELQGWDLNTLQTKRTVIVDDLATIRENKDEANNEIKQGLKDSQAAYDDAVEKLEASDEIKDKNNRTLGDLKEEKTENDKLITTQETVIQGFKDSIATQNATIRELNAKEPSQDAFTKPGEDGEDVPDEEAYKQAHAQWETEKRAAEHALTELELQLGEAEDALAQLEEQRANIDEGINEITKKILNDDQNNAQASAVKQAQQGLKDTQKNYDEKLQYIAQLEANIQQLTENLKKCDDAIVKAEEAEKTKEKTSMGLTTDERIQLDDQGNAYVEVTPWASTGNGNDCLSRIMANNYDFEALGIKPGSEEYNKLQKAVMDANEEIYGTEAGGGRTQLFGGGRVNSVIHPGDKITLPDAYVALGIEKPEEETPVTSEDPEIPVTSEDPETPEALKEFENLSEENLPSVIEYNKDTDKLVIDKVSGKIHITHTSDGTCEVHENINFDDDGNIISEDVKIYPDTEALNPSKTLKNEYLYDENGKVKNKKETQFDKQDRVTSKTTYIQGSDGKLYQNSTDVYEYKDDAATDYSVRTRTYYKYYNQKKNITDKTTYIRSEDGSQYKQNIDEDGNITYSHQIDENNWEICTEEEYNQHQINNAIENSGELTRDKLSQLGIAEEQNDSFAEYAKIHGVDIDKASIDVLQSMVSEYQNLITNKNEFIEMYEYFENNSDLKSYLDNTLYLEDSTWSTTKMTLKYLYDSKINVEGVFNNNKLYNDDLLYELPSALEQMKNMFEENKNAFSPSVVSKFNAIIEKYENNSVDDIKVKENPLVEKYSQIGINQAQGDSFVEFLSSKGIDISTASESELESQKQKYDDLIEKKDSFMKLYELLENYSMFNDYRSKTLSFTDSDNASGTVNQSLQELYSLVNKNGAFKEKDSKYDKNFEERVPSAISQMVEYLRENKSNYSDELIAEIEKIIGHEL